MFWETIIENLPTLATVFAFGILLIGLIALFFGVIYFFIEKIEKQYKENAENIKLIKKSSELIYKELYDLKTEKQKENK